MRINLGDDEQPEIGLIALIDCIFFLLMFFMVATSFKQKTELEKQKQLPVVLPQSSASLPATTEPQAFVIGIDKDGSLYANGVKISVQNLQTRLHAQAATNPHQRIRIDGDQMTAYQNIVRVLDLCQFEGLTNLSMHTRN